MPLGNPPTVTVTVDQATYRPGATITATAVITDPDDTAETITGVDELGRVVVEHIARDDPAAVAWRWQGGPLFGAALNPLAIVAPAASAVLECVVVDGQGNTVVVACPVTVVPPMLIGVNTPQTAADLATHVRLYPAVTGATRVFSAAGHGLPAWTSGVLAAVPAGWIPHVSFKDYPDAASFTNWLSAIPATWREVWVTYHHEPEGDLDRATYIAQWRQLWMWAAGHPNRSRVKLIPIHTTYWSRHKGDWQTWWPGVGDAIGFDTYEDAGAVAAAYTDPADLLSIPLAAAVTAGVPLVIPELGAVRKAFDVDGSARAAWITACVALLRSAECRSVSWWCNTGNNGRDFHLDQCPPELAAWQAAIAAE